jgi:hypothetical protein
VDRERGEAGLVSTLFATRQPAQKQTPCGLRFIGHGTEEIDLSYVLGSMEAEEQATSDI